MAIDPNATPKDYSVILYNKTEIDGINSTESTRVDTELALKSLKSDEGSPSGIATLDSDGKINTVEIPVSTIIESDDDTNNTTLITPERLHYQIDTKTISLDKIGAASGVAPLGVDSLVPTEYLPPSRLYQMCCY